MLISILSAICAITLGTSADFALAEPTNAHIHLVGEILQDNVYIVNGWKVSSSEFEKINPSDIASMTIHKAGSKEAIELAGNETVGVIQVELKKAGEATYIKRSVESPDPMDIEIVGIASMKTDTAKQENIYIADDRKISSSEFEKINPYEIASMTIFKAGSKEAVELAGNETVGVIKVELKKAGKSKSGRKAAKRANVKDVEIIRVESKKK